MSFVLFWLFILLDQCLTLEDAIDTQPMFSISPSSTFLHVCDQAEILSSYQLTDDTMPCNFLYPSSAVENNYLPKFNASYVESFTALTPVKARRCYRLILKSHCRQKWLSPNEMWQDYEVLDVERQACDSSSACVSCGIAEKYPAYDCRPWVFGDNIVSVTVVFAQEVIVHQNSLGQAFYGGLTTSEPIFNLGGELREKVFFQIVPTVIERIGSFSVNPSTLDLISYDMRRLLKYSRRNITFEGRDYAVYDEDHLVDAAVIFSEAQKAKSSDSSLLTTFSPFTSAGPSSSGTTDDSLTNYQAYFILAQLNVTNWYLNYLDCRLKRLALTTFKNTIHSYSSQQTINNPTLVNMLDLGPGEYFKNDFIYKSSCMRVGIGSVIGRGSCLEYRNGELASNISTSGELIKGESCCKKLRINRTHVIQPNHDDTVIIAPQPFTSLLEEEDMLNYPPRVVSNFGYLRDLLLNSSLLNRIEGLNKSESPTVAASSYTPPSLVDWLMSTSVVKWSLLLLVVAFTVTCVAAMVYFGVTWVRAAKPVDMGDPKEVLDRGHPTAPEQSSTRYSFRLD